MSFKCFLKAKLMKCNIGLYKTLFFGFGLISHLKPIKYFWQLNIWTIVILKENFHKYGGQKSAKNMTYYLNGPNDGLDSAKKIYLKAKKMSSIVANDVI